MVECIYQPRTNRTFVSNEVFKGVYYKRDLYRFQGLLQEGSLEAGKMRH